MSFTSNVKNEILKIKPNDVGNVSELSAIISCGSMIDDNIKITTENAGVARHIYSLLKDLFNIHPNITVRKGYNYNKSLLYILEVKKSISFLESLGLYNKKRLVIPESFIVDDPDIIKNYLKGVFLMCGSINDPKTSRYHLEFVVDNVDYASFISSLLNTYYLNSKVLKRDNKYMIYIKEAEKISDFLRIINATSSLFYYEDIRIYRDHKNMTNRLNNCEQANVDKVIETANSQLKDIDLIEKYAGIDLLDEKEKIAITYRKKYPEASLGELSEIITIETSFPITKSGLHHRFQEIKDLASKIKEKENIK